MMTHCFPNPSQIYSNSFSQYEMMGLILPNSILVNNVPGGVMSLHSQLIHHLLRCTRRLLLPLGLLLRQQRSVASARWRRKGPDKPEDKWPHFSLGAVCRYRKVSPLNQHLLRLNAGLFQQQNWRCGCSFHNFFLF